MILNIYGVPALIATIANLIIGGFVYFKGRNRYINCLFAVVCLSIALWNFDCFGYHVITDTDILKIWVKVFSIAVFFLPSVVFHFILVLLEDKTKFNRNVLILSYILSVISSVYRLFMTVQFEPIIYGHKISHYRFYYLFLFHSTSILIYTLALVARARRVIRTGIKRLQLNYFFVAAFIGITFGLMNILHHFIPQVYPIGPLGNIFYTLIIAYSILKHRFLDIDVIISKTIGYCITFGILLLIYIGIVVIFEYLSRHIIEYHAAVPSAISALIIALLFQPFKQRAQKLVDNLFYRGKYEYQQILMDSANAVVTKLNLSELQQYIVTTVSNAMGTLKVALLLKQPQQDYYTISTSCGLPTQIVNSFKLSATASTVLWLQQKKTVCVLEEIKLHGDITEFIQLYSELEKLSAEVCVPIIYGEELKGILTLSPKESGRIFSQLDLDLLMFLAQQATVAIENALLIEKEKQMVVKVYEAEARTMYTQMIEKKNQELNNAYQELKRTQQKLIQSEKLASISQLTVSLNHEINNPLTSILGFSQLILERLNRGDSLEEDRIIKYTTVIEKSSKKIKELVESLRCISEPIVREYLPGTAMIDLKDFIKTDNG